MRSLVTNHTVAMDGQTGLGSDRVSWYESSSQTPRDAAGLHRDGVTADPNSSTFRWMGVHRHGQTKRHGLGL